MTTIDPRDFGRLEGKVDQVLAKLIEHCDDDRIAHAQTDIRLRGLEDARSNAAGRQSVLSVIIAAVVSVVVGFVGRKI